MTTPLVSEHLIGPDLRTPFVTSEDDLEQIVQRTGRALRRLGQECAAVQNAH